MGQAISLRHLGLYVVRELTRARDDAAAEASDGGPSALPRSAEITLAFATEDGLAIEPSVVVIGETLISPEEAIRALTGLERRVLVAASDVESAPAAARGRLVLRIAL
jgi:hypothetical protein